VEFSAQKKYEIPESVRKASISVRKASMEFIDGFSFKGWFNQKGAKSETR
jgi:hypothetical protein